MPTESRIDADTAEQVMTLLELLAADAPVSQIAATEAPTVARDLALRITQAREVHQQREAGLAALLDTARELARPPTTRARCSTPSCAGPGACSRPTWPT